MSMLIANFTTKHKQTSGLNISPAFEVLTVVIISSAFFWDVAPCNLRNTHFWNNTPPLCSLLKSKQSKKI